MVKQLSQHSKKELSTNLAKMKSQRVANVTNDYSTKFYERVTRAKVPRGHQGFDPDGLGILPYRRRGRRRSATKRSPSSNSEQRSGGFLFVGWLGSSLFRQQFGLFPLYLSFSTWHFFLSGSWTDCDWESTERRISMKRWLDSCLLHRDRNVSDRVWAAAAQTRCWTKQCSTKISWYCVSDMELS